MKTYPKLLLRRICRLGAVSTVAVAALLPAVAFVSLPSPAAAAEGAAAKKTFELPAGDAAVTLKLFVEQSGEQVVYLVNKVRGTPTNAVKGEMSATEALDAMLAGTGLVGVQDEKTGALTVKRSDDAGAPARQPENAGEKSAQSGGAPAPLLPPAQNIATEDDTILLSPFVVEAAADKDSYRANSTLAGTRVRTDLADIASSISVVTTQFLKDTGATNNQTLLQYTTNTEVGGLYGNFGGVGATFVEGASEPNMVSPATNTRIRGLDSADNTRDYFLTDIPWDSFNVGRVDIQRGPNSILFGIGSPAGIINSSVNTAGFANAYVFENRVGSYGSVRNAVDLNQVILRNQLAIRIAALDDNTQYRQEPAFNKDKRLYGSVRWDPKLFTTESAHTTLRLNFERGLVKANRPRVLPPGDAITPFFGLEINKTALDSYYAGIAGIYPSTQSNPMPGEVRDYWLDQNASQGSGSVRLTYDNVSTAPSAALVARGASPGGSGQTTQYALNAEGTQDSQINGLPYSSGVGIGGFNHYSFAANQIDPTRFPGAGSGFYKNWVITDPTIFDFYNHLIDGANKKEWQNWTAYNLSLEQTFFNNRLGFQAVYDRQQYGEGSESNNPGAISVDLNANDYDTLPWAYGHVTKYNGTGTAGTNPNAGRAYVAGNGGGGGSRTTDRESFRGTVTGELKATDFLSKSLLSDILGRHVFTGLYSSDTLEQETRGWTRYAMDASWPATWAGSTSKVGDLTRSIGWISYLSDPLFNKTSASGLNLPSVQGIQSPSGLTTVRYYDSHWKWSLNPSDPNYVDPGAPWTNPTVINSPSTGNDKTSTQSENPANYVGWTTRQFRILNADTGDIDSLYTSAAKIKQVNSSEGLTWQAYLWDDMLAATYGWRRDTQSLRSGVGQYDQTTGAISTNFDIDQTRDDRVTGISRSWGVVLHEPKAFRDKLPFGTNFSLFYDEGRNTRVQNRYDFNGNPLANAKGLTKDYGITMSTLNDRLQFKVIWYKTTVTDANLSSTLSSESTLGSNAYWGYYIPGWGLGNVLQAIAGMAGDHAADGSAYNWNWAASAEPGNPALNDVTSAAFLNHPQTIMEKAAIKAFLENMPSQAWYDAYGYTIDVAAAKAGNYKTAVKGWDVSQGNWAIRNNGGLINGVPPVGTVDNESKGIEFEVVGQLLKNWNVSFNASKQTASQTKLGSSLVDFMEQQEAFYATPAGDIRLWYGGDVGIRTVFDQNIGAAYRFQSQTNGKLVPEMSPWRMNLVTNYAFEHGLLRGVNVGLGYRWQDGQILGYALNAAQDNLDVNKPYWGKSEYAVDFWVGYERKINSKYNWRIQLNVRNVDQKADLVPLSVQPDGTPALMRIREGQIWSLTNTFSF